MAENITIFGAGYVGLIAGVCLAHSGHNVTLCDVDRDKLTALSSAKSPIFEPGLEELLAEGLDHGNLRFIHTDALPERLSGAIFIAVGTPPTSSGSADLTYVRAVIDSVAARAEPGTVLVMKSTVPPGTGVKLASRLKESGVDYVSNPEFLREGSAVKDWFQTDRIVLGGSTDAVGRISSLYADIDAPILTCDITSAEMIKYASNAFLATKISFINEIASLCDLVGGQIDAVSEGVGMDSRIGPAFLKPGIGYGGSCFPKDTRALDFLASFNGYDFHLLRGVIDVNARQRIMPVRSLMEHLGDLDGLRVAVLGLTFKPDTDDTREAPAVDIISMLAAEGAHVTGFNPIPTDLAGPFALADSIEKAVSGADAVIVTTEWPEICKADWEALVSTMAPSALIYDGRNCLNPEAIRTAGATYVGVGRPQIGA